MSTKVHNSNRDNVYGVLFGRRFEWICGFFCRGSHIAGVVLVLTKELGGDMVLLLSPIEDLGDQRVVLISIAPRVRVFVVEQQDLDTLHNSLHCVLRIVINQ